MKVILIQDVPNLGKAGDVKEVRAGYGLNYLLPQGFADIATPGALKAAERVLAKKAAAKQENAAVSRKAASDLAGREVKISHKAEEGKLFGSVGKAEIAAALKESGIDIDPKAIVLAKPFKETGTFPVEAKFDAEKAPFTVIISAA